MFVFSLVLGCTMNAETDRYPYRMNIVLKVPQSGSPLGNPYRLAARYLACYITPTYESF